MGMCAASSYRSGHSVWVADGRQRSVPSFRQLAADLHVAELFTAPAADQRLSGSVVNTPCVFLDIALVYSARSGRCCPLLPRVQAAASDLRFRLLLAPYHGARLRKFLTASSWLAIAYQQHTHRILATSGWSSAFPQSSALAARLVSSLGL